MSYDRESSWPEDNNFNPEMKTHHSSDSFSGDACRCNCCCCCPSAIIGPTGPTGPRGATGPTGPTAASIYPQPLKAA